MNDSDHPVNATRRERFLGKVFLVGAGPGDPELLTVRALRLLQEADVVLHDALVSSEILALISSRAQVIDIGKRCGTKLLTQQEINSLLIRSAAEAGKVVRLKSGDPSIFGRAGEEIEALVEAGISFEMVPGVTSALASAAAAGISLTDRRFASSVVFTTAHLHQDADAVAWKELVASRSTLAIYMPGSNFETLCEQLLQAGLPPHTPCTLVSRAGRADQRILYTELSALEESDRLPAPTLLLIGECARPLHTFTNVDVKDCLGLREDSTGHDKPTN
jgi:uroporphyrin-III C-methyltransferase